MVVQTHCIVKVARVEAWRASLRLRKLAVRGACAASLSLRTWMKAFADSLIAKLELKPGKSKALNLLDAIAKAGRRPGRWSHLIRDGEK